jgi:hypothetical protein
VQSFRVATELLTAPPHDLLEDPLQKPFEMSRKTPGVGQSDELVQVVSEPGKLTRDLSIGERDSSRPSLRHAGLPKEC